MKHERSTDEEALHDIKVGKTIVFGALMLVTGLLAVTATWWFLVMTIPSVYLFVSGLRMDTELPPDTMDDHYYW